MMGELTEDQIVKMFTEIRQSPGKNDRAPHKPLLLLLALTNVLNSPKRWLPYSEVEPDLRELLEKYGRPQKTQNPNMPFWRLKNDGLWELDKTDDLTPNSGGDVSNSNLLENNVSGGFIKPVHETLRNKPQLVYQLIEFLLHSNFPETISEQIRLWLGLDENFNSFEAIQTKRRKRNPAFPREVMRAYSYQCAICGLDSKLERSEFGMEAAHIQWHASNGPDIVSNGLALCSIHHNALDYGAISIDHDFKMILSTKYNGVSEIAKFLFDEKVGKQISLPRDTDLAPDQSFIDWHQSQVFKT